MSFLWPTMLVLLLLICFMALNFRTASEMAKEKMTELFQPDG